MRYSTWQRSQENSFLLHVLRFVRENNSYALIYERSVETLHSLLTRCSEWCMMMDTVKMDGKATEKFSKREKRYNLYLLSTVKREKNTTQMNNKQNNFNRENEWRRTRHLNGKSVVIVLEFNLRKTWDSRLNFIRNHNETDSCFKNFPFTAFFTWKMIGHDDKKRVVVDMDTLEHSDISFHLCC